MVEVTTAVTVSEAAASVALEPSPNGRSQPEVTSVETATTKRLVAVSALKSMRGTSRPSIGSEAGVALLEVGLLPVESGSSDESGRRSLWARSRSPPTSFRLITIQEGCLWRVPRGPDLPSSGHGRARCGERLRPGGLHSWAGNFRLGRRTLARPRAFGSVDLHPVQETRTDKGTAIVYDSVTPVLATRYKIIAHPAI